MQTIDVELGNRSYPIYIAGGLLEELGQRMSNLSLGKKVLLITDSNVGGIYGECARKSIEQAGFQVAVAQIPAGEKSKTLEQAASLYDIAFRHGLDRNCPVVALGGGVVGDLAGFVAATYMRGVPFVQVPTTLLAQVDSSVGGKVAVNHPQGKNIIGAFYQPKMVLIDVDTLQSLSQRELKAGLAEVIKYGVIWDADFFTWLESNIVRVLDLEPAALETIIETCCKIKAAVVAQDETEQGRRAILNYGHTIAHAVESLAGYGNYLHGEAVAIGMVIAARISVDQGFLVQTDFQRIKDLIQSIGLPIEVPAGMDYNKILECIYHDKKVTQGKLVFVLPDQIGTVNMHNNIKDEDVVKALH